MKDKITIKDIKNNKDKLSKNLPSLNIDSIFLEQNRKIDKIFYNEEKLHELRSCAKILVAMAVGIAINKKLLVDGIPLSLDTKVYNSIKYVANISNKSNIDKIKKWTIKDLLTHTTGYESQMMSEKYIKDIEKHQMLDYALNYEIPYEVGKRFAYNNVEPFIISVFFQEAFNINLTQFINDNIFEKLNITEYKWDNYGKYCSGATGLYMKHTDFHKIGQLIIDEGIYNNIQIVPKEWINEMCKTQLEVPSAYKPERVLPKIGIGYYTFISRDGYIFRDGSNGQYIIANKDKNTLITIMSTEKDMKNVTEILRDLI
ncbi:MAG: serine hydrolase [Clostridia bacterium]|nr:serine hydrolase [Clostridia bacterium]